MITHAVEIKMRAKTRAGEMLITLKPEMSKGGRPTDKPVVRSTPVLLKEIGISKHESAKYQQLAKVPEKKFEKAIETVKQQLGVLTEAAIEVA